MRRIIRNLGKNFSIKTFGNSMFPLLFDGDIVYIKQVSFSKIKTDDIVCIKQRNKLVTHRVIYKTKKYIITKGDSNMLSDGKIKPMRIVGFVYAVERSGQKFNIDDFYLFQSSIYFEEIKKITKIFEKGKIDFLILKGLPLHLYFEKEHPKRIYADCDILVNYRNFEKAEKLLIENGYRKEVPLSAAGKLFKERPEINFRKISNGFPITLDMHRDIVFITTRAGRVDELYPYELISNLTRKFLREKKVMRVYLNSFPILNNENLIIFLLLHLFKHNFKGSYRYDFLFKLLNLDIDKERIIQIIKDFRLEKFIYPSLLIFKKFYNSPTADWIIDGIDINMKEKKEINFLMKNYYTFFEGDSLADGKHFQLLFKLSPNPLWKKTLIILNKHIMFTILIVLLKKSKRAVVCYLPNKRLIDKWNKKIIIWLKRYLKL